MVHCFKLTLTLHLDIDSTSVHCFKVGIAVTVFRINIGTLFQIRNDIVSWHWINISTLCQSWHWYNIITLNQYWYSVSKWKLTLHHSFESASVQCFIVDVNEISWHWISIGALFHFHFWFPSWWRPALWGKNLMMETSSVGKEFDALGANVLSAEEFYCPEKQAGSLRRGPLLKNWQKNVVMYSYSLVQSFLFILLFYFPVCGRQFRTDWNTISVRCETEN